MGWTSTNKPKYQTLREFFAERMGENFEILDHALVSWKELYIACRLKKSGEVFAYVAIVQFNPEPGFNFGYKDMGENSGPNISRCPERILRLLTPTDNTYALEWRARCWAAVAARKNRIKLQAKDVIVFACPVSFNSGREIDTFEVVHHHPLKLAAGGALYWLTKAHLSERDYKVIREGKTVFSKGSMKQEEPKVKEPETIQPAKKEKKAVAYLQTALALGL